MLDLLLLALTTAGKFLLEQLPTVFGVGLGVVTGLSVDRVRSRRKRRGEQETLLQAYYRAVDDNQELLRQIQQDAAPNAVMFYGLDVSLFEALSTRAVELLDDLPLLERLTNFHYQLGHLGRKLDLQLQAPMSRASAYRSWPVFAGQLATSIRHHATTLHRDAGQILEELNSRLPTEKRLKPAETGPRPGVPLEVVALPHM